jgi:hypothetical protein
MENDAQIVVRLPQEMADRLKAFSDRLAREYGVPVSLGAATRRLIADGLEREGHESRAANDAPGTKKAPVRKTKR